jgi:DNA sulfur modification protein DndB
MQSFPVLRGQIGTTEYFITVMKAAEVVKSLKIPKEMPEWDDESLEERWQREINYERVKKQIAPYLAEDEDRFFGALVVDILDPDEVVFESLRAANIPLSRAFGFLGDAVGILYLNGRERLVPLDGQHRLKALDFAMNGKDEKGIDITTFRPNAAIANDDITLILVKHEAAKARKIFNKINRYAKATSKADNLITSDDDEIAIISREIADEEINSRLVNWKSNTLPASGESSKFFTTLGTIYDASLFYIERVISDGKPNLTTKPSVEVSKLWHQELKKLWGALLNDFVIFRDAVHDKESTGDLKRAEIRNSYIVAKPAGQVVLVMAIARVLATNGDTLAGIIKKCNKIDWKSDSPLWLNILAKSGGRGDVIISGKTALNFASRMIAYMLGEPMDETELKALEAQYVNMFDPALRAGKKLPEVI